MQKRTFKYCATHIDDEKYMQEMCSQGWAAIKLVEGFWTFEKCNKNQYCYRILYLRNKKKSEIEELKKQFKNRGIEFVSQYSFWAIFRSESEFNFYEGNEKLKICKKIYAPMPVGAIVSWFLFIIGILLTIKVSVYFSIITLLIGVYAIICTYLGVAYHKLIKSLS